MNPNESPRCVCGHRLYDHPARGRCNCGNRMCNCPGYTEDKGAGHGVPA